MSTPALVIGVGGAGQWVLTHLKKDLLETNRNKLPDEVKLLSFDTLLHPSAVAGHNAGRGDNPNDPREKRAGAVELRDKTEYIHIGADLNPLVNMINNGELPHLQWINSDNVLRTLPQGALNCTDGAGAIRQLGRLCLINDVQKGPGSKVLSNVRNALTQIQGAAQINAQHRLEIIIVGSIAGGTGAGMLIDMPLIVRKLAPAAYGGSIVVRGFIITPRAFTAGGFGNDTQAMLAYSFATWRELDRWMITSDVYGGNRIQYSAVNEQLNIETKRRLYDITYMIDPIRPDFPLEPGHPEQTLYPAVANVISAILDDRAGTVYSTDVAININQTLTAHPSKALHSAVGSITIKEPVYYEQMKSTYHLSLESLSLFLAPIFDEQTGKVQGLHDDANAETDRGNLRQVAATAFLDQGQIEYQTMLYPNTALERRIAFVYRNRKRDDKDYIKMMALGSLPEEKAALKDVGLGAEGNNLLREFSVEENYKIWSDVPPSIDRNKDPNSKDEQTRLETVVPQSRRTHLGEATSPGDVGGRYGTELTLFGAAHFPIFLKELWAYTEKNLNGIDNNAIIARGGKLGWMIGFYDGLAKVIDYYLGFLQDVVDYRNSDLKKSDNAKSAAVRAWKIFMNNPKRSCWLTFWDSNIHPESHRLQRFYLRAEEQVNTVRKEEIVLQKVMQTVTTYGTYVSSTLDELKEWEIYLAKGRVWTERVDPDDPTKIRNHEIKGLYHGTQNELRDLEENHQSDLSQEPVTEVLTAPALIQQRDDATNVLSQLTWKTNITASSLHNELTIPNSGLVASGNEAGDQENFMKFTGLVGQPFEAMLAQNPPRPLATAIKNHPNGGNGASLANHLSRRAEPFYTMEPGGVGPLHTPQPRRAFIRVDDSTNVQYFKTMNETLTALDNTVAANPITPSTDKFQLTYLRFDDCIESRDFETYNLCKRTYLGYINNAIDERKPRDFHVFPAELHACEFESKISITLGRALHILHPKIVALMDDEQKVEMFFRALALDYIKTKRDPKTNGVYWVYLTTDMNNEIWLTKPDPGYGVVDGENETWFALMHQFVIKGCDVRDEYKDVVAYQVDWLDLPTKINQVSKNERDSKYDEERTGKDGIVMGLRDYVRMKRAQFQNQPGIQERTAVQHQDLADLAETIYEIAKRQDE